MTDINETLKTLGLNENQISELKNWISTISLSTKVPVEEMHKIFINRTAEAIQAGLQNDLSQDNFIEYIKNVTISDTTQIIPPPPSIPIEYTPFGYFPTKTRKQGNKEEVYSETVGIGKLSEGNPEPASVTAYGTEAILKRNAINFFNTYATGISFDPKKKAANLIRGSFHKDTQFDSNTVKPSYLPENLLQRQNAILQNYPIVPLFMANSHLSKLRKADNTPAGKQERTFVDTTDLKVIQVSIEDFQTGRQKSGVEWGKLAVIDSSFIPSSIRKFFNVWIDPNLVRRVGAGKKSLVKIMGTLQWDGRQQYVEMNACAIVPIKLFPLVEQAPNLGGNMPQASSGFAAENKILNLSL